MLSIRRLAKTKRPSVTSFKLLVRNPWNSLCIVYCMGFITKTLFTWIDGSFVAILADIIKGAHLIVWCLRDVRSMYWWMSEFVVGVELATIGKWEWRGLRWLNCHTFIVWLYCSLWCYSAVTVFFSKDSVNSVQNVVMSAPQTKSTRNRTSFLNWRNVGHQLAWSANPR